MGKKHLKYTSNKSPRNLLSHGPNYAVVPRCLPIGDHIAVVEQACQQLKREAEEL